MRRLYLIILSALFLYNSSMSGQTGPECQMIGITESLNFNIVPNLAQIFPGDVFCLEYQVENFDFVIGFQFTLTFDATKFEYNSWFPNPGSLTGPVVANVENADEGLLVFIWTNANATGQTLPDGRGIINMCFTAIGDPCPAELCFNNSLAPQYASTEVNYQIDDATTCSDSILLLDGVDECTQIMIECEDLTIINISVCNSNTDGGAVEFSLCGGTPPYNYTLNSLAPGSVATPFTPATYNNLPQGSYTIEVIDGAGTSFTETINITSDPELDFDILTIDPLCASFELGEIKVFDFVGGTPPYVVTGIQGLTKQNLNPLDTAFYTRLGNGTYTITVEDAMGCEEPRDVTLFTPPLVIDTVIVAASCVGASDGMVTINVSGGVPFANGQYSFNNVPLDFYETSQPFIDNFNPFTGLFSIMIGDDSGCPARSLEFEIPILDTISYNISEVMDVACKGDSTGGFVLTDLGPGQFNDYVVIPFNEFGLPAPFLGGNRNDSLIYDGNMPAGTYTLDIRNFNNGCTQEATFTINEPTGFIELTPSPLSPSCDMMDGSATVVAFGGTQPFSYSWADDLTETSNTLSDVGAGLYSVTVTDVMGCDEELVIEVEPGGFIELDAVVTMGLGCDNMGTGEAAVTIVGSSTPPISVLWFDDDDDNIGSGQTQVITDTGLYYVEVTSSDCVARDTVEIIPGSGFTFDLIITDPTCPTFNNGSVLVDNFNGGTPPYECSWAPLPFIGCDYTNLSEGTYLISIVDADGCEVDSMVTLTNEIIEITFDINATSPLCPGDMTGSIEISNIMGGQGPYTCDWENPSILTCNPMNLEPGVYNFSIIDDNGCVSRDTFAEILPNNNVIDYTATATNPQCGGTLGEIEIVAGMGTNITVTWSDVTLTGNTITDLDAGSYTATIADDIGCSVDSTFNLINESDNFDLTIDAIIPECPDGIDGRISLLGCVGCTCLWEEPTLNAQGCDLVSLSPGIYRVTVSDPSGCQKDTFVDLTVPDALEITVTDIIDAECFQEASGRASVSVVNDPRAVGVYDFIWSNGNTDTDEIDATDIELPVGDNFVIGFDGTCTDTFFFSIGEPEEILLDMAALVTEMTSCNGGCDGSATLSAIGGTVTSGAYTFRWEDGTESATRNDLCVGVNRFTILDDNGCEVLDSVFIEEPDVLVIDTLIIQNAGCVIPNSGQVGVEVDGGCGGYLYNWTDNVSDSNLAQELLAGTYTVTVTDGCGCTAESTYTIEEPSSIVIIPSIPDIPDCVGQQVCIGIDSVSGGSGGNYTYQINFGNNLPIDSCELHFPGEYTLTVSDDNGAACQESVMIEILQPNNFTVDLGPDLTLNLGASDATISANITGGMGPFDYFWNPESEVECVDSLECDEVKIIASGFSNYQVLVIDDNGCEATDDINVEVKAIRNVYIPDTFSPGATAPNNKFMVLTGQGVQQLNYFRIFDRWGNLMYQVEDIPAPTTIDMGWDGRRGVGTNSEVEPGVYVYIAEVQFLDNNNTVKYSGSLTLIR